MASIDEMLFDALRRSNPIGRVIEDFKRAQPDLQAASTAPTGAAFAFLGALRANPMAFTDDPEEQARAQAAAQRARLDTNDPMMQAFLAWEAGQGSPVARAMAANEAAAGTPDGGNVLTGLANLALDPTNLIPIPTGKVGKVANTVRQNEKLAQLMAGVTDAGNGDDLAALIEDAGKSLPLAPEKKDLAAYMKSLGLGKPEAVDSIPSPLVPERTPNLLQLARDGNGVVETNRLNLPLDPSIGDLRTQLRNAQMPQVAGANDLTSPSSLVPDKVPNLLQLAREAQGGKVPSLTAPVKGARAGQAALPESIPATELDKLLLVGSAQNGQRLASLVGAARKLATEPPAPAAATALADDLAASVATPLGQRLELMRGVGDPKTWRTLVERATGSSWLPGTDGTLGDPAADALLTQLAKDFPTLTPEQVTERVNALRQLSGLGPEAAKTPYGTAIARLERAYGSEPARRGFEKSLAERVGIRLDPTTGMWLDEAGQDVSDAVGRFLDTRALNPTANKRILDANFAQFILDLKGRAPNPTGSSMNFTVPGLNAAEIDRTGNLERFMEGAHPAVLNADGTPKVFYHGTQATGFDTFAIPDKHGVYGHGVYMTTVPKTASTYAGVMNGQFMGGRHAVRGSDLRAPLGPTDAPNVKPLYVSLKKPLLIPSAEADALQIGTVPRNRITSYLQEKGYDGIIVGDTSNPTYNEIIAFDPATIKSAIGNRGTYNPNDPSLLRLTPNMRPLPLNGPVPQLITRALTNQATAAPLIGGLAGGATMGTTGGVAGALATPEDRWGGFKQGFAGGAVLGAALGAGSFAYGLRHVTPETWSNLTKHSWELARKDVAETTANATGHSILPTPMQLISFWKNQTVSTMRQFGQDGTWNRIVTEGLQGKSTTKLLGDITQQISERMTMKGFDRLSVPLQERLKQFGKQGYEPKLGMPIVESVAMHGLSRSKSVVSSALLSTFGPGNAIGGLVGAAKGAAMPEFSGMIRHANGALNRGFRETAFVDELDNKLIPLAIDAFKRLGYDLSSVPVDQLTRATVEQMYGPKVGAMWQKTMENMIPMAESRVRYLFGDYTPGQKGAIGIIEKITGPGMPFSSWAIRAYPVALDMAIQNPWVALGVYQFLQATSAGAGKDGRPRWTAGKLPISTEFPLLGAGARTLLGGQKGTAYVDPVGSLSPVGGDLFQPGADQEGPQSLYQQVSEIIGRAGLPGLSPFLQGIAYMLGLDYKGPGNMSRTQGMENSLGLIPGNVDLPGWGDVALRAGRAKLSPAFAGTELGAKLGATGDKYPTVYDPVARRYGELVVKATGKSLDDPKNRAYLYDLAAGTGELYDQARREVLLGGLARNAFSTTSPIGVATQGEDARQVRRDREGVPVPYELISAAREQGTPQQVAQLNRLNAEYKVAEPWAAAYDVGSKSEAESMLMEDALRRYTFRGVQYRPSSPAQLQRVVQAGKERAEGNRIPPKR